VVSDTDVIGVVNIAIRSNNEVHLYYEHDVDDPIINDEAPVALLTGGEEVVGEAETEDIQDQHVVPEENGGEDQPNDEDVVGETEKEDIQHQPNAEEIPNLNAATTDVMYGDDSEDSMYFPSKTNTEDDEFDDDYEAEDGYDS